MPNWHDYNKERKAREDAQRERQGMWDLYGRTKDNFHDQADRLDNFVSRSAIILNSMARLRVYVSCTDGQLAVFLNDAKSKAKAAYLTGQRDWHHNYVIDVASVDIKLRGRAVRIRIQPADAFEFEFATSGKPVKIHYVTQEGSEIPTYNGCMVGVRVQVRDEVLRIGTPRILKNRRDFDGANLSLVERPFQVQLINEPVAYPNPDVRLGRVRAYDALFESFAPIYPWSGPHVRRSVSGPYATYNISIVGGPSAAFTYRDVGFDCPYMENHKAEPQRSAYIRGNLDWPRANGKQLVKSKTFGDREFAIYMDEFNQMAVFPTAAIGPLALPDTTQQNVDEQYVRRPTFTLPAWMWQPAQKSSEYYGGGGTDPTVDLIETDWRFNHLGTRCCAIAMEKVQYARDAFWDGTSFTSTKFDVLASYQGVLGFYAQTLNPDTYNNTHYFSAPGIVELEIDIHLDGPNLDDFTVTVTPREIRRPSLLPEPQSRVAYFVDYVWYDIPKAGHLPKAVKAGTMVAAELELWVKPIGTTGVESIRQTLWSIRNVTTDEELLCYAGMPLLAIDLNNLAFVFRLDAATWELRECPGPAPTQLPFTTRHSGAMIVHSGIVKEVLKPTGSSEEAAAQLDLYAQVQGRVYMADLIAATANESNYAWFKVPINTPRDDWVDTDVVNFRDWWARQTHTTLFWFVAIDPDASGGAIQYKSPAIGRPANADETERYLNALGGDWINLMFCDAPKFGWQQYASLVPTYILVNPYSTFMCHPNGTYAYWDNGWINDFNGLPSDVAALRGPGRDDLALNTPDSYNNNTLLNYFPERIEHTIFDRVHFEIKVKGGRTFSKNTTFFDLYNRAVKAGNDNDTLPEEEEILEMEQEDLRATFVKEIGEVIGIEFLDLKATWDGRSGWYMEAAYLQSNATDFRPQINMVGNFNALNLYGFWRKTNYAGGGASNALGAQLVTDPLTWHIRFANPLVITKR